MKKITLSVLAVLTIAASITSCKKGEEDPGFTFLSRKARIAGEWKITSLEMESSSQHQPYTNFTNSSVADPAYNTTQNISHDGTDYTAEYTDSRSTTAIKPDNGVVDEHTFVIEKDGTWSSVFKFTVTRVEEKKDFYEKTYTETTVSTVETKSTGIWDFLSGVGDEYKNKQRLLLVSKTQEQNTNVHTKVTPGTSTLISASENLYIANNSTTFDENKNSEIWSITQLKNKEMKVESTFEASYKGGDTFSSSTFNDSNKDDEVTTTGSSKIIFSVNK